MQNAIKSVLAQQAQPANMIKTLLKAGSQLRKVKMMMHVLIYGYYYGQGAEGVCTQRLCDALMDQGLRISIATSDRAHIIKPSQFEQVVQHSSFPVRPQRHLQSLHYLMTGGYSEFPAWGWRAALRKPVTDVDVIYARTRPLTSAFPALMAAKCSALPLVLHFSDPAPSPWLDARSKQAMRETAFSAKLARRATVATFTTLEALELQRSVVPEWADVPSYIVPHIAPEWARGKATQGGIGFLYVGSFYGARGPHSLLKGFAAYQRTNTYAKLTFLGSSVGMLRPIVQSFGLISSVDILEPVLDVRPVINEAAALVAVDSFEGPPVFMSTKFVEYLATDKPIVLISPRHSPSAKLASDERAAIYLADADDPTTVAIALRRSASNPVLTEAQRSQRARLVAEFSADRVAAKAVEAFTAALQRL